LPVPAGFQEHFCLLFNIVNLNKVIQTKVDVKNELPSTSLPAFYSHSIDLIQDYLLSQQLISDIQSNDLSSIFARMRFLCVDSIDLSYCYESIIKLAATSYSADTYIDKQSGIFYILKKYETSEMRFIDAMAEFITEDETIRSRLSSCIKKLLQIYQKDGEQGLTKVRESLAGNHEPKWVIPEEIKKEDPPSPPMQEEEEEEQIVPNKPVISNEQLEQLMNEPSLRPKPKPKEVTVEEEPKPMTSFPNRAGLIESNAPPLTKSSSKVHAKPNSNASTEREHSSPSSTSNTNDSTEREHTSSSSTPYTNDQNDRVTKDRVQDDNQHLVPRSSKHTNGELNNNY
jgi:hypothetical protein